MPTGSIPPKQGAPPAQRNDSGEIDNELKGPATAAVHQVSLTGHGTWEIAVRPPGPTSPSKFRWPNPPTRTFLVMKLYPVWFSLVSLLWINEGPDKDVTMDASEKTMGGNPSAKKARLNTNKDPKPTNKNGKGIGGKNGSNRKTSGTTEKDTSQQGTKVQKDSKSKRPGQKSNNVNTSNGVLDNITNELVGDEPLKDNDSSLKEVQEVEDNFEAPEDGPLDKRIKELQAQLDELQHAQEKHRPLVAHVAIAAAFKASARQAKAFLAAPSPPAQKGSNQIAAKPKAVEKKEQEVVEVIARPQGEAGDGVRAFNLQNAVGLSDDEEK
ncbi:hypothetical protein K435DRAFT_873406 [Dendrothele bispora CBS 962.96]|uniref:Uncharacterized protein n=1 Tax=Dendrothele bispora (strain CBS 962.96) TaxID=1314807 RepID=A0A4S8KZL3_DENBC|nr:hypothetical protein K435DRAFT_873406 [Dendrothele bispora CBS 962.96]